MPRAAVGLGAPHEHPSGWCGHRNAFCFLCGKQLARILLDLLWVAAFLNDGERGQRKPCNLSFMRQLSAQASSINTSTIGGMARTFLKTAPMIDASARSIGGITSFSRRTRSEPWRPAPSKTTERLFLLSPTSPQ